MDVVASGGVCFGCSSLQEGNQEVGCGRSEVRSAARSEFEQGKGGSRHGFWRDLVPVARSFATKRLLGGPELVWLSSAREASWPEAPLLGKHLVPRALIPHRNPEMRSGNSGRRSHTSVKRLTRRPKRLVRLRRPSQRLCVPMALHSARLPWFVSSANALLICSTSGAHGETGESGGGAELRRSTSASQRDRARARAAGRRTRRRRSQRVCARVLDPWRGGCHSFARSAEGLLARPPAIGRGADRPCWLCSVWGAHMLSACTWRMFFFSVGRLVLSFGLALLSHQEHLRSVLGCPTRGVSTWSAKPSS